MTLDALTGKFDRPAHIDGELDTLACVLRMGRVETAQLINVVKVQHLWKRDYFASHIEAQNRIALSRVYGDCHQPENNSALLKALLLRHHV